MCVMNVITWKRWNLESALASPVARGYWRLRTGIIPGLHGRPRATPPALMKCVALFALSLPAIGQVGTAGIHGAVIDAKTHQPIPAAWVTATRTGAPPFTRNTKSGGDGAFQIQGLTPGNYTLCVQAPGDQYLDPCLWNGNPTTVSLTSGQTASGISLKLTAASMLSIQVYDSQKLLGQLTKDGRHPDLALGVWGPKGL